MHYNFVNKNDFQRMTNSGMSGYNGSVSYYTSFVPIGKKSLRTKELHSIETITSSGDLALVGPYLISSSNFAPYKNYFDGLYPDFFDWDSNSSAAIVVLPHGDGIVLQSINYTFNNVAATGSVYDFLTTSANENFPVHYKKIGYLQTAIDNLIKGYILYGDGVCIFFNEIANSLSSFESGDSLQFSTILDQHEMTYSCLVDGEKIWSSSNSTYWSSIDESNTAVTSSLTAYWNENNYSNNTIANSASAWMIIEQNDKPVFVTSIGLYNNKNECLAVATLAEPFRILENFDITFLVKFRF